MPHAISPVGSRPLDFHDIVKLNKQERERAVAALGPILMSSFTSLHPSWAAAVSKPDPDLKNALQEWRRTVPAVDNNPAFDYCFDFAVTFGQSCFSTMSLPQRIAAAKVNGFGAIIDDQIVKDPQLQTEVESLLRNVFLGRPIKSPLLQTLTELMRSHVEFYQDPTVADYLHMAYLNFIVGCTFENRTTSIIDALKVPLTQPGLKKPNFGATDLPYFIRSRAGVSETWALGIFAQNGDRPIALDMFLPILPELMQFTDLVNDLLSAPKEIMKADDATYLVYQTYAKRQVNTPGSGADGLWCFEDSFVETCDRVVELVRRLDAAVASRYEHERVKDEESLAAQDAKFIMDTWMTFKAGIIEMHFDFKRYHVKKWLPEFESLRIECRHVYESTLPQV